ncbi:hypothetical protein MUP77_07245, partial [Candidatus Bathyarchaeota archaeon]|nr:hypothetical protein [Candidatus Bathyarchaeota archaeon]
RIGPKSDVFFDGFTGTSLSSDGVLRIAEGATASTTVFLRCRPTIRLSLFTGILFLRRARF